MFLFLPLKKITQFYEDNNNGAAGFIGSHISENYAK